MIKKPNVTTDVKTFSLGYGVFCLLLITSSSISSAWSRNLIAAMFGYGVIDHDSPYYYMSHELTELNS